MINDAQEEDFELEIERVFPAPRERVWRAFTEAEDLLQWYCPEGLSVSFYDCDLLKGGSWRCGMRAPSGQEYIMKGTYQTITPPEHLEWTHTWEKDETGKPSGRITVMSVDLFEEAGKTRMVFKHSGFATTSSRDAHYGGWSEAIHKLANGLLNVGG